MPTIHGRFGTARVSLPLTIKNTSARLPYIWGYHTSLYPIYGG